MERLELLISTQFIISTTLLFSGVHFGLDKGCIFLGGGVVLRKESSPDQTPKKKKGKKKHSVGGPGRSWGPIAISQRFHFCLGRLAEPSRGNYLPIWTRGNKSFLQFQGRAIGRGG